VIESLEGEIRTLRSLFWSDRDPEGRGFVPLADAYRRAGDLKQAHELLNDGLGRHPDFSPGHVVAARLYGEQGLFAEAEIAARSALELDPENVDAMGTLIVVLEERGEVDEARGLHNHLSVLDPEPGDEPASVAEEEVVDFAALAPDEPGDAVAEADDSLSDDDVTDFGSLAPDEPPLEEPEPVAVDSEAVGVSEDQVVHDFVALSPEDLSTGVEEPAAEEEVLEVDALAPEGIEPEMVDLDPFEPGMLAEEVQDFAALAPDEVKLMEELAANDPNDTDVDDEEAATAEEEAMADAPAEHALADPINTRTMAELYVTQGLWSRAVEVYRNLVDASPDKDALQMRLDEVVRLQKEAAAAGLEELQQAPIDPVPSTSEREPADEVETLARDLAEAGDHKHDVDTPFAWAEQEAGEDVDVNKGPTMGEFFGRMLTSNDEDDT
jgi:tetratricopeptide (TPR) repeat protein